MNKRIVIIGGGTLSHVRAHLALAAVAYGDTAKKLGELCQERFENMDVEVILTKMADPTSHLITSSDVDVLVTKLINDNSVKAVFFNAAICDFDGTIEHVTSGKYAERLKTRNGSITMELTPSQKIIGRIRELRKDIFLVGFKTTSGVGEEEQFYEGLNLLKKSSCNLVLANDLLTRNNIIITPEEGVQYNGRGRDTALKELVDIAWHRTHLSFTRSTVVEGKTIPWNDAIIPCVLREVVNWCVSQGAYKRFNGVTTGHFACKVGKNSFLTSIRKTDFNDIDKNGLVYVKTDGPDDVIAYGRKPSVGGQSQRIIFGELPDTDCIVHFHCPLKEGYRDLIPIVSQREYECGSHECGENTVRGLAKFGNVYAVMLDKHGPNIVFGPDATADEVKGFIEANFDLTKSTSGFEKVYLGLEKRA